MFINNPQDILINNLRDMNVFAINLFIEDTKFRSVKPGDAALNTDTDGYLLSIPYTLVNIDLFQRKVLTPVKYAEYLSGRDLRALITWKIVNAAIEHDDMRFELEAMPKLDVVASILACMGVAYQRICDFDDAYIDVVSDEILESGELKDDAMYFHVLVDEALNVVQKFMSTYMIKLADKEKAGLLDFIGGQYLSVAEMAAKMYDEVEFHPEAVGFMWDESVGDYVE